MTWALLALCLAVIACEVAYTLGFERGREVGGMLARLRGRP